MKEKILNIEFFPSPKVIVRVISFGDTEELCKSKKKFPFKLKEDVKVIIKTTKREISFIIQKGYTWNGADIPRFLWSVLGSRTDNDFLIASMLHDFLLEFKFFMIETILENKLSKKEYRRFSSLVFRHILKNQGTNTIKANIMSYFTDLFQMISKSRWRKNGNIN